MIENILAICEQLFLYIPLIIGAYISFSLMKLPFLSIEAALVSGAIMASKVLLLMPNAHPLIILAVVCLASLISGGLVGGMVAALVMYAKIPQLLANILT